MNRRDAGNDGDVRAHLSDERGDLARVIHAGSNRHEARLRRHARERQRHAPVIVVGRRRGMRFAETRQHEPDHVLASSLADGAGDGGDERRSRARAPSDSSDCCTSLTTKAPAPESSGACASSMTAAAAFLKSHPHEVVTIARLALDGEEQIAGLELRVSMETGSFTRKAALMARPQQRADQRQSDHNGLGHG
jgi:hypothetical protein